MSDSLFAADSSATNATEYTVSEISGALKRAVEDQFGNVRVRGEISGYRGPHSSGHAYFALKDDRAKIDAVVWRTTMARLKFRPEEGMEVIASGKLTTYPGKSSYQIVVEKLEPAGAGALMALLEERKRRLQAEGLFDPRRKRRLPFMPRVIGVITSPTGAVIRDILHRIRDRFPLHVIVWPVRVQGETASAEVTAAVQGFNALGGEVFPRPDLLIVARGGGSLEDLWGFNDEALARAVAASDIPVISAVGHETDWTLVDHVADVRAPTPTGAAEIAVPVKAELEATLASLSARLGACLSRVFERKRTALRAAARVLPTPDQLFALPRRRLDEATSRLGRGLDVGLSRKRAAFAAMRLTPASLDHRLAEAARHLATCGSRLETAQRADMRDRRARVDRAVARMSIEPLRRRTALAGERLAVLMRRKDRAISLQMERLGGRLARAAERVSAEPLLRRTGLGKDRLSALMRRKDSAVSLRLERLGARLGHADRLLNTLSHQAILERGFALVLDEDGNLLRRAADAGDGEVVSIQFADAVKEAITTGGGQRFARRRSSKKVAPAGQGSLF